MWPEEDVEIKRDVSKENGEELFCFGFAPPRPESMPPEESRGNLAQRESLSLALLLERPSAFDPCFLLFKFLSLPIQLLLHLSVSCVQLFFALLELALLLRDLLLEDHLHLQLHLLEFRFVERALLLLLDGRVDLLEDTRILLHAHGREFLGPVVFVQEVVGVLLELFHVRADKHLSKLDKITVFLVVNLDDTPWITAPTNFATISSSHLGVGTDDSEGNLRHNLIVLCNSLLIIKLISGTFEYLDFVVMDVCENLYSVSTVLYL